MFVTTGHILSWNVLRQEYNRLVRAHTQLEGGGASGSQNVGGGRVWGVGGEALVLIRTCCLGTPSSDPLSLRGESLVIYLSFVSARSDDALEKNPFYEKTKRKACIELIGIRITQLRWTSPSLSKFIETLAWILLFSDFWKSELKDKPTALKINDAHIYFIVSCFMSRHLYRNWKGKQWISLDSEDAFTRTRFFLSLWLPLSQSAEKNCASVGKHHSGATDFASTCFSS